MDITGTISRFRIRSSWVAWRDQRSISEALAYVYAFRALITRDIRKRLALLVAAARRTETAVSRALVRRLVRPWTGDPARRSAWREHRVGWDRYYGGVADIGRDRALTTSLVLKEPGPDGEKGVLYCSFEFNWMRVLANHDARRLFRKYLLVGASSWSPGDHAVLASLQGLSDDPAFIGISNETDMFQYRIWEEGRGIVPLPILSGDWIDPDLYQPVARERREFDIVMVSHFARWKRHWLLFEALRKLGRPLRVVLVGRHADARTEADIRREARAYGVSGMLDIRRNLEIDEVAALQCNAKVAVALSRREGSCVAVTEAMFADTPVVMMDDAHVGTRRYINPATGRIASRRTLARTLGELLDGDSRFAPRAWAIENISAQVTSDRLNRILRHHCTRRGLPWTRDIKPMCWRYVPQYLHPGDAGVMGPAVNRLREEFGIELAQFEGERAALRRRPPLRAVGAG